MLSDNFLNKIPNDLVAGGQFICKDFFEFQSNYGATPTKHDNYVEYYMLLESFLNSFDCDFSPVLIGADKNNNISTISSFFNKINNDFENKRTKNMIFDTKNRFDVRFNNTFSYEFTDGDLNRVQVLISEIRDEITKSELFDAKHKDRLLRRLEKLQSELHKKVSDLDRFWGLIGDAGVVMGKFGNDVKPIVDRIKEITKIVWNTQAITEQLPSGTTIPFLTTGESDKEEKEN